MNLNELAAQCHAANIKWWQNIDTGEPLNRNRYELLALVVSEISEALEGERRNLMDDKLPHRKMAEVEMADAFIRILDFAAGFGVVIDEYLVNHYHYLAANKGEALFSIICGVSKIPEDHIYHLSVTLGRIRTYCMMHGYDLMGAFHEKMAFNATREDHTHEARRIAGGKQF